MVPYTEFPLSKPVNNFGNSVTRLSDFWKLLGTKFFAKVAQIFNNNFGLLRKMAFFKLNGFGYFLGNLWRKFGFFLTPTSGHTGN